VYFSSKVGEKTSKVGEKISKVGDKTSKVGDKTSKVGDKTSSTSADVLAHGQLSLSLTHTHTLSLSTAHTSAYVQADGQLTGLCLQPGFEVVMSLPPTFCQRED